MISMRGQAADYDHWRQLGLTGWGWNDVFPVFKRLDDHFLGECEHHGAGGEWRVEQPRVSWAVLDSVAKAANQMGIPATSDFNTGDNTGVGYFHVNQKRGFRWSAARAFLKPVLHRHNLRLETGVLAEKVLFEGRRATGVQYLQGGRRIEARARGEVILCAGSIGSPLILHRSGVGPAGVLSGLGIPIVADRPGVGGNLQDHLQQRAVYKVRGVKTLNQIYGTLTGRALMGLEYLLFRRGPLTMAPSQLGIFTKSSPEFERPNIEFMSSRSRSTASGIRCTAFPQSPCLPAIFGRYPAERFVRARRTRPPSPSSHPTISRLRKIAASRPMRSESRGA